MSCLYALDTDVGEEAGAKEARAGPVSELASACSNVGMIGSVEAEGKTRMDWNSNAAESVVQRCTKRLYHDNDFLDPLPNSASD